MFIKWRREERQIIESKEKCSSNQTLFSYLDTPINAVKEPDPSYMFVLSNRTKFRPQTAILHHFRG